MGAGQAAALATVIMVDATAARLRDIARTFMAIDVVRELVFRSVHRHE